MDTAVQLFTEILPLYMLIVLGFITGKVFTIDTKTIATLTVFVISPIVFIFSLSNMQFTGAAVFAPVLTFIIAVALSFFILVTSRLFLPDNKTPYLAALMSGTNNWGYLGLPIAFTIFDPHIVGLFVAIGVGLQVFENSFGVYFISRGNLSPGQSFKNIFRYPVLYALGIGFVLSYFQWSVPFTDERTFDLFKGAYTVLGMMIIGLSLADMKRFSVDVKFTSVAFLTHFILWPFIALGIIWFDKNIVTLLGESFYGPLLLLSFMPMAANNAAFAAKFDMNPGKASVGILATTLFAIVYIPLMIFLLI